MSLLCASNCNQFQLRVETIEFKKNREAFWIRLPFMSMGVLSGALKQTSWFEKSRALPFWAGFGASFHDALRFLPVMHRGFTQHAPRWGFSTDVRFTRVLLAIHISDSISPGNPG